MALVIADRVRETTTTTGTGTVTLAGPYTSFQSFSAGVGNGNSTYYTIASAVTGEWEVGIGTYTASGNTLSRTTVLASSNAGSLVNFSSGSKDVFVTQPAERSLLVQSAGSGLFSGVAAFTANGVPYADSTSTLTSGTALQFNGATLGVGVTPQTWWTVRKAVQIGDLAALASDSSSSLFTSNIYSDAGGTATYLKNSYATGYYQSGGQHLWYTAPSGIAGDPVTLTQRMTLDNSGNLGIGTSSPLSPLNVQQTGDTFTNGLTLTRTGASRGTIFLNASDDTLRISRGNTQSLAINVSGNLGVGTASPNKRITSQDVSGLQLDLYGTGAGYTSGIQFRNDNSAYGQFKYVNGSFVWDNNNGSGEVLRLDSSGNLGIGLTPTAGNGKLQVQGANATTSIGGVATATLYDGDANNEYAILAFNTNAGGSIVRLAAKATTTGAYPSSVGQLEFGVQNGASTTTVATMTAAGNMGIGTTSPSSYGKLAVIGGNVHTDQNFTTATGGGYWASGASTYGVGWYESSGSMLFRTNTTERMRIDSSGNLGVGTSAPGYRVHVAGNTSNPLLFVAQTDTNASNLSFIPLNAANGSRITANWTTGAGYLGLGAGANDQLILNSAGNLGLGVTPVSSQGRSFQFGVAGALELEAINTNDMRTNLSSNAISVTPYANTYKYLVTGAAATMYQQAAGLHRWFTTGATTGTAGNTITFTQAMTLDANGSLLINATNANNSKVRVVGASDVDTRIQLFRSGSVATSIWSATGAMAFGVDGTDGSTERMRILDSSGNVGIGTSSPGYKLDVNGAVNTNTAGFYSGGVSVISSDGSSVYIKTGTRLYIQAGSTTLAQLTNDGNLGLGVTPSAWGASQRGFDIGYSGALKSSTGSGSVVSLTNNAYYTTAWTYKVTGQAAALYDLRDTGEHRWYNAPSGTAGNTITFTQAMTLDASGNLGIGTTSPSANLEVKNSTGAANLKVSDGGTAANTVWIGNRPFGATVAGIYTDGASSFAIGTNSTERARITSGGYFKASDSGGYFSSTGSYHELFTTAADRALRLTNSNASPFGINIYYNSAAPNGTGNAFVNCSDNAASRALIYSNGGIANYQANDVNLSDRREKTNFEPAGEYLSKICAIPVQTFNYIDQSEDDPGKTLGVVAQDVQAVAPELVMESDWGTEDNPKVRLSIYQTDLQYALMKCIQEQQVLIEQLTARVASLEGK